MTDLGLIVTVIIFLIALGFTGRDIIRANRQDRGEK